MVLNPEMATTSPPFGPPPFVMNGVASPCATTDDVHRAAFPFVGLNLAAMAAGIVFPVVVPWPPGPMG